MNTPATETKETYRILEDGEETWSGKAYDADHALERFFGDEEPSSMVKYTIQKWGKVKVSSWGSMPGWEEMGEF